MQAKGYRQGLKPVLKLTRRKPEPSNFQQALDKTGAARPSIRFAANQRLLLE
jgi:hypothetical protein